MNPISIINTHPIKQAHEDYKIQRYETITLVVTGILLFLSSIISIALSSRSPIIFPLGFAFIALLGCKIALRTIFFDWTPYHDASQLRPLLCQQFVCYYDPKDFLSFAKAFNPVRLQSYGWISNITEAHYRDLCQTSLCQPLEIVSTSMMKWNDYIQNVKEHQELCLRCQEAMHPSV